MVGRDEGRERGGENDGERRFLVSFHKTPIPLRGPHIMISSKPTHRPPPSPTSWCNRTSLTPYWNYCFSSNLCALFAGLTPAGSAPCRAMPPTAWNPHHSSCSGLWLPGWTLTDTAIFIHIEMIFLFWRFIGVLWQDLEWTGPKDITLPLGSGQHQEACDNQSHSLPFQYKRSLNSNSWKMALWDTCHVVSSMSLDSVMISSY